MADRHYNGTVSTCTLKREEMRGRAVTGQTTDLCLLPASSVSITVQSASNCSQRCWGEPLRRREVGGGRGSATLCAFPHKLTSAPTSVVPSLVAGEVVQFDTDSAIRGSRGVAIFHAMSAHTLRRYN